MSVQERPLGRGQSGAEESGAAGMWTVSGARVARSYRFVCACGRYRVHGRQLLGMAPGARVCKSVTMGLSSRANPAYGWLAACSCGRPPPSPAGIELGADPSPELERALPKSNPAYGRGVMCFVRARILSAQERFLARGQSCNEEGDAVASCAVCGVELARPYRLGCEHGLCCECMLSHFTSRREAGLQRDCPVCGLPVATGALGFIYLHDDRPPRYAGLSQGLAAKAKPLDGGGSPAAGTAPPATSADPPTGAADPPVSATPGAAGVADPSRGGEGGEGCSILPETGARGEGGRRAMDQSPTVMKLVRDQPEGGEGSMRCMFWNTRNLCSWGERGGGEQERGKAAGKLRLLEEQLEAMRPDVLFLGEVGGPRKGWGCKGGLASWLAVRGYTGKFVAGSGGRNGIVAAVAKATGSIVKCVRVIERGVGLMVKSRTDGRTRKLGYMHGRSAETKAAQVDKEGVASADSFAGQLEQMDAWIGGSGVLCGDFNRVVCSAWRRGGERAVRTEDDERLVRVAGWRCACCDGEVTRGDIVPCEDKWTRWEGRGARRRPTSYIDYALARGEEREEWRVLQVAVPDLGGKEGMVSDHGVVTMERRLKPDSRPGEGRPKPFPIGKGGDEMVKAAFKSVTVDEAGFEEELRRRASGKAEKGEMAVTGVVEGLVEAGRSAVREADAERAAKERQAAAREPGKRATPKQRYQAWRRRLRDALRLSAAGVRPDELANTSLSHSRTIRRMVDKGGMFDDVVWEWIIRRCRSELAGAGKAHAEMRAADDRRLLEVAKDKSLAQADAVVRMQRAWRAIRERSSSCALEAVWRGDRPPAAKVALSVRAGERGVKVRAAAVKRNSADPDVVAARIPVGHPEFKAELGRIGDKFVRKMGDSPACVPAFEAWCALFMEHFGELEGVNGGPFRLAEELTWEVFNEVLFSMPGGKAVGAGGFHIELLRQAGGAAQRAFYDAMIADIREGRRVPAHWRKVLYVLLEKPGNDNSRVDQRREIALMAHDMKMLLQMVRRVSYQRMVGRVMAEQAGWIAGFGCADPGSVVTHIIQQSAKLGEPLWLLFIDLSTFFPRCDREVLTVAEAVHGLPREVRELAIAIYGAKCEPHLAVECQYDSADGMGDSFRNWMGALMGCVLSPDKAKILLNTVVVAISLVCKGVQLWGGGGVDGAMRQICQAMYADDWCGAFRSLPQLRKAWTIWRMWERAAGCKLGVKGRLKTVVTGVKYVQGKAVPMENPLLRMSDGSFVPFMLHDEAYKHLGNMRRADGDDAAAWAKVKRCLDVALARLRRLWRPTVDEFLLVTDALLGGLASYYLQTFYITFEQAEEIERKWRAIYRWKFGGSFEEDFSKPRAFYYLYRGPNRQRRRHLWGVGLAAVVNQVNGAMADISDTPQRAAARSAVALAMSQWGCRTDPQGWQWAHLEEALETHLKRRKVRCLGDAWMLATLLFEIEHQKAESESEGEHSPWHRDFPSDMHREFGRWKGAFEQGDPMHSAAPHFAAAASPMISEPLTAGGLGLEPEPWLLQAGVVAVGHMCRSRIGSDGRIVHSWCGNYAEARRRNPGLVQHGAASKAWERQLRRLEEAGIAPVAAERALAYRIEDDGRTGETMHVDVAERVVEAMGVPDVRARRSKESWTRELRRCFPTVRAKPAVEWTVGGRDRAREARGAKYVMVLDRERTVEVTGGTARWDRRGKEGRVAGSGDAAEDAFELGADGWAAGWRVRAEELALSVAFDDEGYVFDVDGDGGRLCGHKLGSMDPAIQLQARARIAIGEAMAEAEKKLEVVDEWPAEKRKHTHVNLAVQRRNHQEACEWSAKIRATAMYTVDASRDIDWERQGETSDGDAYVTRAAVRHDGQVLGGRLREPEGADNYIGELAAQLDAAAAEDEGGRVIVVFDATSPVLAMKKFRRQCARRQQGYYVGEWLEALFRLWDRQEVVVLLWQNSHRGSPVNEWADLEASAMGKRLGLGEETAVPRLPPKYYSVSYSRARRTATEWSVPLATGVVSRRLAGAVVQSELPEEADMPYVGYPEDVQRTCEAVLAQRSCYGDEKRRIGRAKRTVIGDGRCPHGCTDARGAPTKFTWLHAQVGCSHPSIVAAREAWLERCKECEEVLTHEETKLPHHQVAAAVALIKGRIPRRREGRLAPMRLLGRGEERELRRLVGGLIYTTSSPKQDRASCTKKSVRAMVRAGAAVQWAAHELTKEVEKEAAKAARETWRVRKFGEKWLRVVREGGPARAAALREAVAAAAAVVKAVVEDAAEGRCAVEEAEAVVEAVATRGEAARIVNESEASRMMAEARGSHPRVGAATAYQQWRLLALASRWRLRTMQCARRRSAWHEWELDAEGVWTAAVFEFGEAEEESEGEDAAASSAVQAGGSANPAYAERTTCVSAQKLYERLTGRAMRQDPVSGSGRFEWLQDSEEGIGATERRAAGAWLAGGSWRGELRRRRVQEERRAKRVIAAQAARFVAYMRQTDGQVMGLSGRPVVAGEEVFIEIGRAARGRAKRRRAADEPQRSIGRRLYEMGAAPDRWGRWKVDKIAEVRWRRGGMRGRERKVMEVRLRWAGLDPGTGLPYKDSWTEAFGRDAEGVMILSPELRRVAAELERKRFGVKAPRRPADAKGGVRKAVVSRATATAKWQGRFRSDKRGREEAVADTRRGVSSRVRIGEDGAEEVRGVEWALADIRRQRSVMWSLSGQGPKRRKRWAVVRDGGEEEGSGAEV